MKIAFCTPVDIHSLAECSGQSTREIPRGLGSTAVTPLLVELVRRGHEIDVYTLDRSVTEAKAYGWNKLRVFVGPYRKRHVARDLFRPEINFLAEAIQKSRPPFIHAHWTYEFALGAIRSGVPTITTIHDLPWKVLWHFRNPYRLMRLIMAYEVAWRGRYFTAVSNDAAEHFRRYFHPKGKIAVIPNGLPDIVFHLGHSRRESATRGTVFATVLQGMSRQKNPVAALKAFAMVRRQIPEARLIMFGAGYETGGPAHEWATLDQLDADVTFAGSLENKALLARIQNEVDIVVQPSLDESFSMVAVEAMALKKPVIGGKRTPGVREVLDFGKSGVLVDVTEPAAIAQEMIRLARDAGYRDRVAQSGFRRAALQFRLGTVVSQYEGLYDRIFGELAVSMGCLDNKNIPGV